MLARLDTEVAASRTDDEIMAIFVAEYGNGVTIKPKASGFGLVAWMAPIALLMVGAVAMAGVISHWRASSERQTPAATVTATAGDRDVSGTLSVPAPEAIDSDRYRDIVERELDAFDD
jgi:cytochrome c-type biogenesis protein CcmH/NrfF